jgi:hypothetical protein
MISRITTRQAACIFYFPDQSKQLMTLLIVSSSPEAAVACVIIASWWGVKREQQVDPTFRCSSYQSKVFETQAYRAKQSRHESWTQVVGESCPLGYVER